MENLTAKTDKVSRGTAAAASESPILVIGNIMDISDEGIDFATANNRIGQQPQENPRAATGGGRNLLNDGFTKILDNLYLTSAKQMTDENLINHHISHIVNATRTVPLKRNYRTWRVNIVDSAFENIGEHFDPVADFIDQALESDGAVVVHCISGISRSSTLVIAYLMKYRHLSLKEAFEFVRSKRPFIKPNNGFFKHLIDYELKLHGSNSVKMVHHPVAGNIPDFILEDKPYYKYFYLCTHAPAITSVRGPNRTKFMPLD